MCEKSHWLLPQPFVKTWKITADHIDHYNHVNNVAYVSQLESLAWAHSNALGLTFSDYSTLGKGMVIRRHELDYRQPAFVNDILQCATWVAKCDGRLTLSRQFQFYCPIRKSTVFSAVTEFVCVNLKTGAPSRMPGAFKEIYGKAVVSQ